MAKPHVIIIGAGITGLLLAQALKTRNISFEIYERDPDADARGQGWGLAVHWALDSLRSLLPEHVRERLPEAYVDPTLGEGCGRFPLFRLDSGERWYENLSEKRVRVSRERLRALLMSGLDIQWSKDLDKITQNEDASIKVEFTDGSLANGTFLAGCDGTRSRIRKMLCALSNKDSHNYTLPVRFLGASVVLRPEMAEQLRSLDPLFFQASHPNGSFMFFGIQDTPANNDRTERDTYRCQINMSWPYRQGFLDEADPIEIPESQEEQLELMRKIADAWTSPFKDAIYSIPEGHALQPIKIEDYVPSFSAWEPNELSGKVTVVGDAAHAMTMYRGEACNHNIKDVESLVFNIMEHNLDFESACHAYEKEMTDRTSLSVLASRRACLDAHEHGKINDHSPLISKRAIVPGGSTEQR